MMQDLHAAVINKLPPVATSFVSVYVLLFRLPGFKLTQSKLLRAYHDSPIECLDARGTAVYIHNSIELTELTFLDRFLFGPVRLSILSLPCINHRTRCCYSSMSTV